MTEFRYINQERSKMLARILHQTILNEMCDSKSAFY